VKLTFVHEELGASTRYRVHNHVTQARLAGLEAEAVPLAALGRRPDLRGADLLYLHRLRLTTQTLPLIAAARLRRVPVVYDSDDLIWDPRLRAYERLDARLAPAAVRHVLAEIRRARWLIALADALVLSTPFLAGLARARFRRPAHVHLNALSAEVVAASEAAAAARRAAAGVTLAHFSGSRHVHDDDLAAVGEALRAALAARPDARLLLVGEVAVPAPLAGAEWAPRVERRPPVGWPALPALIAAADLNLAPLVDNPQRRAKSAVKYLEAAAVGVPTLAARLEPYSYAIIDGVTGALAETPAEWAAELARLAGDRELRRELGAAARRHVLAEHTATARAPEFRRLVTQIAAAHHGR
jgi:glycosyltransferase involved in cell wall biosynthesis